MVPCRLSDCRLGHDAGRFGHGYQGGQDIGSGKLRYAKLTVTHEATPTDRSVIQLHKNAHTILGTVVVAALILQPFLGLIHHWRFKKTGGRTVWSTIHKWYGRVFMILGIVAGGSGLGLASDTPTYSKPGMIAYAVLAAVAGVALLALWTWVEVKQKRRPEKAVTEGSNTA